MARAATALLVCLVLAGCGTASSSGRSDDRPGPHEVRLRAGGLRVTVLTGWHGRQVALPASPDGDVLLQLATVPLERDGPSEGLRPHDVVVTLTPVPGPLRPDRRSGWPRLRRADFRRVPAHERPVGHDVARRVVVLPGVTVRVEADFGSRPAPPDRVRQVEQLLDLLDSTSARRAARRRPAALDALLAPTGPRLWAGVEAGRSAQGRPITVTASGEPTASRRALVVGCTHGTECAGMAVARRV